ncbi:MAG: hypothetical protein QME51_06990, partial [Planctomycetota bacterium]|nr:hypothetical protein [Planctomycetota bacterium]
MDFKSKFIYFKNNILLILILVISIPFFHLISRSLKVLPCPAEMGLIAHMSLPLSAIAYIIIF